jgi:diguanylate cyclase (GGDEF)-like protein
MEKLRRSSTLYIATIGLAAFGLAGYMVVGSTMPDPEQLVLALVFAAFQTAAMVFPLQFASGTVIVFNSSVILAVTLLFPPSTAMLIVGSGTLLAYLARRRTGAETLFNTSQMMLQVGIGSFLLAQSGWNYDQFMLNPPAVTLLIFPVAGVMYLIEFMSVTLILALQGQQSPRRVWRRAVPLDSVELFAQFTLGVVTAVVAHVYAWMLPLLLTLALVIYRSRKRQLQLHTQSEAFMHQAMHDPLTGLPNRAFFVERLTEALARATQQQQAIAILFLDLDRFKVVNDSLGHAVGDQLLIAVAKRLQACVRPQDTVARLGGDEFTMLIADITHAADAIRVADRINEVLRAPFLLAQHEVVITTSIGITLSGAGFGQHDLEDLLRDADTAMYSAKHKGKARHELFDPRMHGRPLDGLKLEAELHHAITRREFTVYYQPQVDLATGRIGGLEALVRWNHPQRGLLCPNEFIPLAEETELILAIGQQVLEDACCKAHTWQEQYRLTHPVTVCVNLSTRQFQDPALVETVAQVLERTSLAPDRLQLEITESVMMEDIHAGIAMLHQLRKLGVQIAIDDFGTGYSSLTYLKHFPADVLKIDKSFVERMGDDSKDTAIVSAITVLAQTLGMRVVAEGIETAEQLAQLRALGCDRGQGFLFSPPRPSDAVAALFAARAGTDGVPRTPGIRI